MLCGYIKCYLAPHLLLHFLSFSAFQLKTSILSCLFIYLFMHLNRMGHNHLLLKRYYTTDIDIISDYVTENYTNLSYSII